MISIDQVAEGAPTEALPVPVFGDPVYQRRQRIRQKVLPKQ